MTESAICNGGDQRPAGGRRPAAIAFADIVGYSALMAADEGGTHARWMALLHEVLRPETERRHGRIVDVAGDGVLAEFPTVVAAVDWARVLQRVVPAAQAPEHPPVVLRIAVHWGEVIHSEGRIFGDVVNTAARLQGHADPGGILLSEAAYSALRDAAKVTEVVPPRDLGPLPLKNIKSPVRAFALDTGCPRPPAPIARPTGLLPSVAVLPLLNLAGDPGDEFLAAGMVEDIVLSLSGLHELMVIAHASTLAWRGLRADPREVGRALGVRYTLTGSLQRAGRKVRVSVQLSDAQTGANIWADRAEASEAELFDLQDAIALRIAAGMLPSLRAVELRRTLRRRPESYTAYEHTLRALDIINTPHRRTSDLARSFLDLAMAEDPGFSMPVAWAAWWHCLRVGQGWAENPDEEISHAVGLAKRAIRLDPDNALALATHGHLLSYLRREYDAALAYFERALTACPNSAFAQMMSSATLSYIGHCEGALARAERALRLSPTDPSRYLYYHRLALAHFGRGDIEAATRWSRMCRAENAGYTANLRLLAAGLATLGHLDEAREAAGELIALEPGFHVRDFECRRQPFQEENARVRFITGLRQAGLSD